MHPRSARLPFSDRTNDKKVSSFLSSPAAPGSDPFLLSSPESKWFAQRSSSSSKKRTRTEEDDEELAARNRISTNEGKGDSEEGPSFKPVTIQRLLRARASSTRLLQTQPLSTRPILLSLVSSHQHDVYRIHSATGAQTFDAPFACAYTYAAKSSGKQLLAVSTQGGKVEIMETNKRCPLEAESPRTSFQAHDNAVFDVRWSPDDTRLATAAGDRTGGIFDAESSRRLGLLSGHIGSLKQVQWGMHNPNILATASRDGNIHVWDLRNGTTQHENDEGDVHAPVLTLSDAHGEPKKRGRKSPRTTPRSVTAISFVKQRQNCILSAGSADGVVKLWDLRYSDNSSQCVQQSADSTLLKGESKRARGISSLVQDNEGEWCFALGNDSKIHIYPTLSLSCTSTHPLSTPLPTPLHHPAFRVSSFYVKLSVSPCGNWLASGSTGGPTFAWDLKDILGRKLRPVEPPKPVILVADRKVQKETGCVDWAYDGVLSQCSDDMTVRVWRPDAEISRKCLEDTEAALWNWGFSA